MKVIINEQQFKYLILEDKESKISNNLENMKSFAISVLENAKKDMGINLRMLTTWGAAVGGVMVPLNNFIQNGNFEFNEFQLTLVLVATCSILFGESKRTVQKLISIIKKENLESEFNNVLEKGTELKNVFISFLESLNVTFYTMTNIMSYAFIIPILPIIWEISQSGLTSTQMNEIVLRLSSFGVASVSANLLKQLFRKLIERFGN